MILLKGDLPSSEGDHRWRDKDGDVWIWDTKVRSWCSDTRVTVAVIFPVVPARFGPFERID